MVAKTNFKVAVNVILLFTKEVPESYSFQKQKGFEEKGSIFSYCTCTVVHPGRAMATERVVNTVIA